MKCRACGGDKPKLIGELPFRDFDGSVFNTTGRFHECPSCGFACVESGLTDEAISRHYETDCLYAVLSGVGIGGDSPEDIARYASYLNILGDSGITGGRIADIGCSRGGFLKHLLAGMPGFSATGVDIDEKSLALLDSNLVTARRGSAFDLPFADSSMDILCYFHVLEHVYNLETVLKEAWRVLEPKGFMLVEVPDAPFYGQPENRVGAQFWIAMKEHVNHFSPHCLGVLLNSAGFMPVRTVRRRLPMKMGRGYPSLIILAQKMPGGESEARAETCGDKYFSGHFLEEKALMDKEIRDLWAFLGEDDPAFWGIGLEFLNLFAQVSPRLAGRKVSLLDSNPGKQGLKIDGLTVQAPETRPPCGKLVCCSHLSGDAIMGAAIELGWKPDDVFRLSR